MRPYTNTNVAIPLYAREPVGPVKNSGLAKTIFSPGTALAVSLFAYYPLASFTNFLFPEGNLGSILIRLLTSKFVFFLLSAAPCRKFLSARY
jgi:hypothetical protein